MNDRTVTNTSKEDPLVMLGDMMRMGTSDAIEAQEAQGQKELVNSSVLPSEILHSTQADFEALGFVFGDLVEGDPLFRHVQLPEGWIKKGSDHAMWSYVEDDRGIERVAVFYKAAFYDRSAHMYLDKVGYKIAQDFIYGDDEEFVVNPALTDEEKANVLQTALEYLGSVELYPDIYDQGARAQMVVDALSAS